MTTHLRGRAAQAGALLALVGGIIAATATPALAAGLEAQIDSVQTQVEAGKSVQLRYTVSNTDTLDPPASDGKVKINVSAGGMKCGGCSSTVTLKAGDEKSLSATLTAPDNVPAGQTRTFQVQISLNGKAAASETITVSGPDKPANVRQVSGKVKDDKGKRLSGAQVVMQDSAGHRYDTTSNDGGNFAFTSSDSKPIAVGSIVVGAGKDDHESATVTVQGGSGKTVNVTLTLATKAGATPSATPSVTEEASAPAEDEATDEATDDASTPALNSDKTAGKEDGSGSLLFIILGGLLVAAGVGAIVLVLMRRKNNGGGDGDGDDDGPAGPGPAPAGRGGYGSDATRVAAPVGGGRAGDATMVAGAGGMSDAPTVLQRAVPPEDEFPDPYGVPAQQQPAYGAAANQYGSATQTYGAANVPAQGTGYDDEQYYDDGQQQGGGGYYGGAPQQQQPQQQRYDEPTGMYRPEEYADDYQQPQPGAGGAYGHGAAAPQPQQQYDGWDDGGAAQGGGAGNYGGGAGYENGYDNGYDQRAGGGGGYEAGYDNGYDQRGGGGGTYGGAGGGYQSQQQGYDAGYDNGYDQGGGGYDQRGGAGYDQGGYYGDGGGNGGGDQGGRRGGPPRQGPPATEEPARPGQRRLPWMDD
ncbi:carboxypeptidase-like regulatory domain-containing protein [Actinoplanes sp. NPDC049265]|uniref:carboxypeptidase-like regulatory domain-containing protein n=1 Tax=Actinoplanes sp. NPDC049265 TaxID=3363902 RepID=UPI0037161D89